MQDFSLTLRVMNRQHGYLLAALDDGSTQPVNRSAVVTGISFAWVERFCPHLWRGHPPERFSDPAARTCDGYLDLLFGRAATPGR